MIRFQSLNDRSDLVTRHDQEVLHIMLGRMEFAGREQRAISIRQEQYFLMMPMAEQVILTTLLHQIL